LTFRKTKSTYKNRMKNIKKISSTVLFLFLVVAFAFAQEKSTDKVTINGISYYLHKVGKKESLYAISKTYNVDIDEIKLVNPSIETGLQKGKTIKIPIFESEFKYHAVEKGQTAYSIAKSYDITPEILTQNNPFLSAGLAEGDILKIPRNVKKQQAEVVFEQDNNENKGDVSSVINYVDNPCGKFNYTGQVFKIALLLPLFVEENKYMSYSGESASKAIKYYQNSKLFLEYYEGTLLALDSLRKIGVSVDLHVFDTKNSVQTVKEIANLPIISEMDLIIGPVYSSNIKAFAQEVSGKNINIISPLDSKDSLVYSLPNVFQVNSSDDVRIKKTAQYISKIDNRNIVIVHGGTKAELNMLEFLRRQFASTNDDIQEISFRKSSEVYKLQSLLVKDKTNVILTLSEEEVVVTNLMNRLMTVADRYLIAVFGSRRWETFSNMDFQYYGNLNIHYHSNTYTNDDAVEVVEFTNKFERIYNYEPSEYAMHGFDITFYFGQILKKYGKNFNLCLANEKTEYQGLHTGFYFEKNLPAQGYENNSVYIIRYDEEFRLKKMDSNRSVISIFGTE